MNVFFGFSLPQSKSIYRENGKCSFKDTENVNYLFFFYALGGISNFEREKKSTYLFFA